MFFRSLFYERTVLRHLERVEQLPAEVQAQIAMRVGKLIELARPVSDALLERFAEIARQVRGLRCSWPSSVRAFSWLTRMSPSDPTD